MHDPGPSMRRFLLFLVFTQCLCITNGQVRATFAWHAGKLGNNGGRRMRGVVDRCGEHGGETRTITPSPHPQHPGQPSVSAATHIAVSEPRTLCLSITRGVQVLRVKRARACSLLVYDAEHCSHK